MAEIDSLDMKISAEADRRLCENIAKLGNKSVQTAIDNIPKLAVAMDDLMRTLSKSPKVRTKF